MRVDLVLVFTSRDRPGLVDRLTQVVVGNGGNWEESRLARLCGDFAGIARVSVDSQADATLRAQLVELGDEGIDVHVRQASESSADADAWLAKVSLSGADHEGIVNRVASRLAELSANVEELATNVVSAPITGTPLFQMQCQVTVPNSCSRESMAAALQELEAELGVDVEITDA